MKLKINSSYVNGTDIGHPDGQDIFYACCCGSIAGSTPEEREHYARLMVAAPKMYELLEEYTHIADADTAADWFQRRQALLDKIEGGGE